MKQKKMLALTFSQLKQIYNQEIPEVVEIADKSSSVEEFKAGMLRFLEICRIENEAAEEAREQIRLLLDYDGQNVHELSTGQDMSVQTIRLLYEFLTGTLENMEIPTDLFIEIFQMFKRLKGEVVPLPSPQRIKSRNDRWETGLDEEVREVRDENPLSFGNGCEKSGRVESIPGKFTFVRDYVFALSCPEEGYAVLCNSLLFIVA